MNKLIIKKFNKIVGSGIAILFMFSCSNGTLVNPETDVNTTSISESINTSKVVFLFLANNPKSKISVLVRNEDRILGALREGGDFSID